MDTVLILGRPSSRGKGGLKRLQVYRTPIPVDNMTVEDLDGSHSHGSGSSTTSVSSATSSTSTLHGSGSSSSKPGSFKSAFSGGSNSQG